MDFLNALRHPIPARSRRSMIGVSIAAFLVVVALVVSLIIGSPNARATVFAFGQEQDSTTVTIVDITDFHGHIERGADVAGAFELARSHNPGAVIPVSAGDLVGGSPYDSASQNDEPTLRMTQVWGLHISALGNHELDRGVHDFNERIAHPDNDIDWLCANARKTVKTSRLKDYVIRKVNGRRIAFVGAITDALRAVTTPRIMKDITLDELAVHAINRVADQLSDGDESNGEADAVVALLHADAAAATKTGAQGLDHNVDLVYAGHSHAVKAGRTAAGAPVIEAGSFGADMAVQDLTITGYGRHAHVSVSNVNLGNGVETTSVDGVMRVAGLSAHPKQAAWLSAGGVEDSAVSQCERIAADAKRIATSKGSQVVGTIAPGAYFGKNTSDSRAGTALGTLVANAQREKVLRAYDTGEPADHMPPIVGFSNNGSLRTSNLDANGDGRITLSEVDNMLALQFHTAYVTLTGAQLKAVLAQQWREHDGKIVVGWLGISSNVSYRYETRARTHTGDTGHGNHYVNIINLKVDGHAIADTDTVIAAGNSFLLQGGDRYKAFCSSDDYHELNIGYNQALIDYLGQHPRLKSESPA